MELLSGETILTELCKIKNKYGIFMSIPEESVDEIINAALWFDVADKSHMCAWTDGHAFLFFDTEEEMEDIFEKTVGPNGKAGLNQYSGLARVFALTCDPSGKIMYDNA